MASEPRISNFGRIFKSHGQKVPFTYLKFGKESIFVRKKSASPSIVSKEDISSISAAKPQKLFPIIFKFERFCIFENSRDKEFYIFLFRKISLITLILFDKKNIRFFYL